jgi:hypothetical protein
VRKRIQWITAVIMLGVFSILLTGCSGTSKSELELRVNQLEAELGQVKKEKEAVEGTLKSLTKEGEVKTYIDYVDDKTKKLTFNKLNDRIIFDVPLEYPDSSQTPNNSRVSIAGNVNIVPSNNWIMVSDGTALELNHTSGIYGVIQVSKIAKTLKYEDVHTKLEEFNGAVPSESEAIYGKLFLDTFVAGDYFRKQTLVDGSSSVITAGLLGAGTTGVVFVFMYDGEPDSTKDEIISNLIRTMELNGLKLKFE